MSSFFIPYNLSIRNSLFSIRGFCNSLIVVGSLCLIWQCSPDQGLPAGDKDNGGLYLPNGFEAVVVVDSLKGRARHLTVNSNGDIYVKLRFPDSLGGNAALRDTNNDGKADIIKTFDDYQDRSSYGTEMKIHNGYLYFSSVTRIYRQKLTNDLLPDTPLELILSETERRPGQHSTKPLAFDKEGHMYTVFGAPSDACQEDDRSPMSPGIYPCPILEHRAGIWKFDANKTGQFQKDGKKFATGLRSVVGLQWNTEDDNLYAVVHGRDYLHNTWPREFSAWEGAVLPSEVFLRLKEGDDAGWPYHYYDQIKKGYYLNPEYGGDGSKQGDIDQLTTPVVGFPGHFAPNDLFFYDGDQFPERYKNGAFIAFHGSTSSSPYPQSGYFVGFVPMKNGMPTGPWEVFADGFAGRDTIVNTSDAAYRPMGLAVGPEGSLYVSDSEKGKIWRIMFKGDKAKFDSSDLAGMAKRKQTAPNIKTPDEYKDLLIRDLTNPMDEAKMGEGGKLFNTFCSVCHQRDGLGNDRFPPLNDSEWVLGDKERLINVVLQGLRGEIIVKGKSYNNAMPKLNMLSDDEIAEVLTYIRQNFGNNAAKITPQEVEKVRKQNTSAAN
ncbi:c-type cytochrome [Pareuzebyella sediminis]|uniref:c-type cytochrome n=1 Tax=Pareuzebyella sediminis TaxID=2607998 RepID=UPI0011EBF436|nr:c-type cytochrome [Pareuzebyella sediminis]